MGDRRVTTVKQVCLGVAVAGAVAGAGAVASAALASADAPDSGSGSRSSSDGSSNAAGPQKSTKTANAAGPTAAKATGKAAPAAVTAKTITTKTIRSTSRPVAATTAAATDVAQPVLKSVATTSAPATTVKATFDLAAPASSTGSTSSSVVRSTSSWSALNQSVRAAAIAAQVVDPTKQHVLLIGVDGTNLGRILDNPTNTNFFDLMNDGTTAASSIVGHTTISNPSWTAILTGVWDTKSGVINNVFTPDTYNSWPTVFNQLEGANPDIYTKAIADWQVITDIAGAGSKGADENVFIAQVPGDTNWSLTDAAVTQETIDSLNAAEAPNFMFTYLVQVDEAGHMHGGASQEYADAISRTDTNLGAIMDAVHQRELDTGEEWTVIVVTDHGHQAVQGFGHGFQSPDETSTFVIYDRPGSDDGGLINTKYEIVDVTPTVVSLFGIEPTSDADGVPLSSLGSSVVDPVDLHQALNDLIDMNGYPSLPVDAALTLRTIFATIPYYVNNFTISTTAELQAIVDQQIFFISTIAAVAKLGVQIVGDTLYLLTNAVAQIVGRLTGAGVIPPSTSTSELTSLPKASVLV